jgi:signal transduction histidine kinase
LGFELGLYLSRQIIERHNWRIWETSPDKARFFYFTNSNHLINGTLLPDLHQCAGKADE